MTQAVIGWLIAIAGFVLVWRMWFGESGEWRDRS